VSRGLIDLTAEIRPRSSMRITGSSVAGTRARDWNFCKRVACCVAICWLSPNLPADRSRSKYFDLALRAVVLTRNECSVMSKAALACSIWSTRSPFLSAMSDMPPGSVSSEALVGLAWVSMPSMIDCVEFLCLARRPCLCERLRDTARTYRRC
jgi:hypothetical protein